VSATVSEARPTVAAAVKKTLRAAHVDNPLEGMAEMKDLYSQSCTGSAFTLAAPTVGSQTYSMANLVAKSR